jgi:hypothetical protein
MKGKRMGRKKADGNNLVPVLADASFVVRPTHEIVLIDGVECRVWKTCNETGPQLTLFVHRLQPQDKESENWCDKVFYGKDDPRHFVLVETNELAP